MEIKEKSPPPTQATEPDLGALLGLIAHQDQAAFARLYDASSARVYGLALLSLVSAVVCALFLHIPDPTKTGQAGLPPAPAPAQ